MIKVIHNWAVSRVGGGSTSSPAGFAGTLVVVFALAFASRWCAASGLTCVPAANACWTSMANTACTNSACTQDSGYTCMQGRTQRNEGWWNLQTTINNILVCTSPNNTSQGCASYWLPCGATNHFRATQTPCYISCVGNWQWVICQATGTQCTGGTGGTGGGGGGGY